MVNKDDSEPRKFDNPVWSDAASTRLDNIPEGPIREMARKAVDTLAAQSKIDEITEDFVAQILSVFQKGSSEITETLAWDEEARSGISRAPDMVRGMLVKEIEGFALNQGANRVTAEIVNTVKAKWMGHGAFHLDPDDPRAV